MSIRIGESHPALVHLPLGLYPLAFFADLLGKTINSAPLLSVGRRLMPVAAASAARGRCSRPGSRRARFACEDRPRTSW